MDAYGAKGNERTKTDRDARAVGHAERFRNVIVRELSTVELKYHFAFGNVDRVKVLQCEFFPEASECICEGGDADEA